MIAEKEFWTVFVLNWIKLVSQQEKTYKNC